MTTVCSAARTAVLVALVAGCAHRGGPPPAKEAPGAGDWVVVPGVVVYAQRGAVDCGPAAFATMLSRWGVPPDAAWHSPRIGGLETRATTAGELRDEARRLGFRSYVIEGSFDDLDFEIAATRPVLVGLVRTADQQRWAHFSVVVGREAGGRRWLLADPSLGLEVIGREALDRQWAASGFVTLVLLPDDGRANPPASSQRGLRAAL